MAPASDVPEPPGSGPHEGHDTRQVDQDRTLAAIHDLEAALGAAAPRRERAWHDTVMNALQALDEATAQEASNARRPDSLLSDIERTQPRLRSRIHGVRAQYVSLRDTISSIRDELAADEGSTPDFAHMRQRLTWLINALRYQRARESDLIYEAYYDAFDVDIPDEQ